MLINKENHKRLKFIAKRMAEMGFGEEENLEKELLERYVSIELRKIMEK